MRNRWLSAVLVVFVAFVVAAVAPLAQGRPGAKVTNGTKVGQSAFDARWGSIVSIQQHLPFPKPSDRLIHSCGGTLIAPDLVLTARHCAPDFSTGNAPYEVLANHRLLSGTALSGGASDRATVIDWWVRPAAGVADLSALSGDVAILQLDHALSAPVMRLVGPDQDALWGAGKGLATGARAAGWGNTDPRPNDHISLADLETIKLPLATPALREVALPLVADATCESSDTEMFLDSIDFDRATMLCGGTIDTNKRAKSNRLGVCNGDSGGPLVVPDGHGGWLQAGIVSWGPSYAGGCNSYSVFVRIAGVRDWIQQTVAAHGDGSDLSAGTITSATQVGANELRVTLGARPGVDRARQVLVLRELTGKEQFDELGIDVADMLAGSDEDGAPATGDALQLQQMLLKLRSNTPVARGGAEATQLLVRGVAPRRAGQRRYVTLRLVVDDAQGRQRLGPRVQFSAPVDSHKPHGIGRPRATRGGGPGTTVYWAPAHDDDCVSRYVVQIRAVGGHSWRRRATIPTLVCKSVYQATSGASTTSPFASLFDDEGVRTNRLRLTGVAAGAYDVRVIAVDRAGNREISRAGRVSVTKLVRAGDEDWMSISAGILSASVGVGSVAAG